MSRLEELISMLCCSEGVEYKTIGEVFELRNGYTPSKNKDEFWNNGNIPWFRMEDIRNNGKILNKSLQYVTQSAVKNKVFPKNSLIVATTATIGIHALIECDFLCNQQLTCVSIKDNYKNILNIKFCFYYFDIIDEQCIKIANQGGGMPIVSLEKMKKLLFPVPPLEVQNEIVRILDKFNGPSSGLLVELSAELKARKNQYNYYRDKQFLDLKGVKKYKLNEIATIYDGTHQTPKYTNSGIHFISVENISNIYNSKKFISEEDYNKYKIKPQINDVFMTRIGSIGKCAVFNKEADIAYYVSLALIRPNNKIVNSYYLKYLIESIIGIKELRKRTLINAVPIKINKDDIGKIVLPIPSLEEQEKIVSILDKFEKLCNDISEGIPAEIKARQKQYEYYRNKLLSLKRHL